MASTIIQVYLKQVLESFFHLQSQVRMCALEVVVLILRQGLVHPVQVSLHVDVVLLMLSGSRVAQSLLCYEQVYV